MSGKLRPQTWSGGLNCAVCGLKEINVVHEQDPEHSPEGPEYHAEFAHHQFTPVMLESK